jgi:hypothetical protein
MEITAGGAPMTLNAFTRRICSLSLVLLATSQVANATSSDAGTLTVGVISGGSCTAGPLVDSGYVSVFSKGSYSPTGLTGGKTVALLIDYAVCSTMSELDVAGFSANPGTTWLTSVTCNGVKNNASAGNFIYIPAAGEAIWQWPQTFGFLALGSGSTVSCTIVHN